MDRLEALERRGDDLVVFANCERQADAYIKEHGTQELVDQLKLAVKEHRLVRIGTINTIVLVRHIERLEAELAKEPLHLG